MVSVIHDSAIIVVPEYENPEKPDKFIKEVPGEYKEYFLKVTAINGYTSYIISPDGSKESFQTSKDTDKLRKKFQKIKDNTMTSAAEVVEAFPPGIRTETRYKV